MLKRFWLLLAQVVTIAVGGLLAWKAVTPDYVAPPAQIVTVREEANPPLTAPHTESFMVLAIGNPFGVGQTVTQGIVSATGRHRLGINTFENFIQTDAAINTGNSGGALIDSRGALVGINTAIFSESGGSQGIGFAIPVSLARQVMEQIITKGRVDHGWLCVAAQDTEYDATVRGARIMDVQRGGPADRAGLRPGDVIVAINDKPIADTAGLINTTAALTPGARGDFKIRRNGKELGLQIKVGRRPPQPRLRPAQ